ncbi:MAG TPA: branched-chain amino acid ABC transporter permease, partial [Dehalococcoidia bacterium]|nr:branched-chain amino acid ABC transporter permease [Dehalococcoidia bacterium]
LVIMYRTTGVLNLAIGETSTLAAFLAWTLIVSAGLPYWLGLILAAGALGLAGAALEAGVLSRLSDRDPLTMIVITAGLLSLVRDFDSVIWGDRPRAFPTPFHGPVVHGFGMYFSRPRLGTFLSVCVAIALLVWFFQRTRLGLALRAAAQRPEAALLCGVPVRRMRTLGWGVATALGAVGGILIANIILLDTHMLEGGLIYALAGAALGGLDQPAGAIVGGVVVGVMDGLVGSIGLFKEIQLPVVVLLVFIVLTAWPDGLLGTRAVRSI